MPRGGPPGSGVSGTRRKTVDIAPKCLIIETAGKQGGMKFLIVEDSRTTRNLIKNYVSEMDISHAISFVEAENGEIALDLLELHEIDFVFLDWKLSSKMTGLEVLKAIRKKEKFKKLPVVMVTSESEKGNVIESLKCGANDFTVKPIDKKAFSEKVLKIAMGIIH